MVRNHSQTGAHSGKEWAIIDIGSNTVRLVIFTGPPRAPRVVLNEKVNARLGKGVVEAGRLAPKAQQLALLALERYALILRARGVATVTTVATAASREATNGPEFLEAIAKLGLNPQLLSGEAEALTAAEGVIGAFPAARGVVADLGGGSLELVRVADGKGDHGTSLPYGSLRLPERLADGAGAFQRALGKSIRASGFACPAGEALYLVGGSYRALARYFMHHLDWPLDDPHGFTLAQPVAKELCQSLLTTQQIVAIPGMSASRTASLPTSAALLLELIREIDPANIVFSSWGLREGLNFAALAEKTRTQSPLIAGVAEFAARQGVFPAFAAIITGWTAEASLTGLEPHEELRLAATMLALATQQIEPNLRVDAALDWALRKRWIGTSAKGRAMIAACVLANCGAEHVRPELARLAASADLDRAAVWGGAVRLCRRLGGGSTEPLSNASLRIDGSSLVLTIDQQFAGLINPSTGKDLRMLAQRLSLEPHIVAETV